jgi:hypothetical protein
MDRTEAVARIAEGLDLSPEALPFILAPGSEAIRQAWTERAWAEYRDLSGAICARLTADLHAAGIPENYWLTMDYTPLTIGAEV